ncbi:hypothetical protein ACP4OV_025268 [Aristida adscensionis]
MEQDQCKNSENCSASFSECSADIYIPRDSDCEVQR